MFRPTRCFNRSFERHHWHLVPTLKKKIESKNKKKQNSVALEKTCVFPHWLQAEIHGAQTVLLSMVLKPFQGACMNDKQLQTSC